MKTKILLIFLILLSNLLAGGAFVVVGPAGVVAVVVRVVIAKAFAGQYHSMSVGSPHSSEILTAHTGAKSFSNHRIALWGSGTSTQLVQLVGVPLLHSMAVSWSA